MFDSPGAFTVLLSAAAAVGVIVIAALGSFVLGPGARRGRALTRAQDLLRQGQWQEALDLVGGLKKPTLSPQWQGKLNNLEGECHLAAAEAALKDRRYEEGAAEFAEAAQLLSLKADELKSRVLETMLADVRRQFAEGSTDAALRAAALTPCAEASFWQGLCHLRQGDEAAATTALATAQQTGQQKYLDPPLYLGALRLRQGKPQEALRFLSEANRTDANCPV